MERFMILSPLFLFLFSCSLLLSSHSSTILAEAFHLPSPTSSSFQRSICNNNKSNKNIRDVVIPLSATPLSLDNSVATVISLFPTKDEAQQQKIITILQNDILPMMMMSGSSSGGGDTTTTTSQESGFVAAHLHSSLDGKKIGIYEQWTSAEAHTEHMANTEIQTTINELLSTAGLDPTLIDRHIYEIVTSESNLPKTEAVAVTSDYPLVHFAEFVMPVENQPKMIELAKEHIHPAMELPGLLTATFHKSIDGVRVINYGQWENEEAIKKLKEQPGFGGTTPYWDGIAENEHHMYRLIASFEK